VQSDLLLLVDSITDYAIFVLDPSGRVVSWNRGAERLKGYRAEEIIGRHFSVFYPRADRESGKPDRDLAVAERTGKLEDEGWRVRKDGTLFWASIVVVALRGPRGELRGYGKITRDLTERREAEQSARDLAQQQAARSAAEAAQARLEESEGRYRRLSERLERHARYLAEATAAMAESLDYAATMGHLARLLIPALADWCAVAVVEGGRLQDLAVAHVVPSKAALVHELQRKYVLAPDDPYSPAYVVRTGHSVHLPVLSGETLAASTRDAELSNLLRALGPRSAIVVPIRARGATLGAMSLVYAESGRTYDSEDLALAEELGRRAGIAIENARAYGEARAAIRLRDEFLSVAGHEFKTPLTALLLQIQSVHSAFVSGLVAADLPRWGDRVGKAVRQGQRLERLVNELLDVSRITSGRLTLEREEVDLAGLCTEVAERHAVELARSGSTVTIEPSGRTTGTWDRGRLDQVITNLLSNAIKYGQGKPITVTVAGGPRGVTLSVRDRGIGIRPEDQARIFGRFERAVSERHYGGFGLGLWIVRELVEAHGGQVRFESCEGAGSTFVVDLPFEPG